MEQTLHGTIQDGVLVIKGTGDMADYKRDTQPWKAAEVSSQIGWIFVSEGVTSIGNSAFNGLSALTKIVLPDSVKSIGTSAFYGCSNLEEIILLPNLENLGGYVFNESGIKNITIPASVKYMGLLYGPESITFWETVLRDMK